MQDVEETHAGTCRFDEPECTPWMIGPPQKRSSYEHLLVSILLCLASWSVFFFLAYVLSNIGHGPPLDGQLAYMLDRRVSYVCIT